MGARNVEFLGLIGGDWTEFRGLDGLSDLAVELRGGLRVSGGGLGETGLDCSVGFKLSNSSSRATGADDSHFTLVLHAVDESLALFNEPTGCEGGGGRRTPTPAFGLGGRAGLGPTVDDPGRSFGLL